MEAVESNKEVIIQVFYSINYYIFIISKGIQIRPKKVHLKLVSNLTKNLPILKKNKENQLKHMNNIKLKN